MGDTAKIVAAAVGGYVLGRRKKFKLALGLGLYLGAKKLDIKPGQLAQGLLKEVSALPVVGELKGQSREQLLNVGRTAAGNIAGKWAGGLADSLNSRTERLREGAAGAASGSDEDGSDEDGAARDEAVEDADETRDDGDAEARGEPGGDSAPERRTRPKAAKASRGAASGTAARTKGAAARTKGTAKRASASAKPARRKRASGTGGKGGDDGRDD
ncbi:MULTISPECIES: hypothetical protein [Nocardiopsis]|uniref:DNA primase n=1 Tax=Nocardiopsis dassonvillei (strain ATCC 23218 / DSM 43111 / CIP 107115 / JCM 7437 / KCTC 9190 / NBRC 14626 / NCTC 10488 / NRRL B-5397 / IMRU 509) TaxID=446468 RepID=D7AVT6_NOCDD|nr:MULTISPECIES: hypothetical protein [Nocardiopsis]ADH67775.1 conserved hypothetical protein [Nocardiopsis dassonvillei subsp. dassonvillei DSM 43111]NKY81304.1 hypothetical protein [Nocardiopsis dassonvillei]VEI88251.1 Uncharacterised protein [Nocardiopsis dassonvillei]